MWDMYNQREEEDREGLKNQIREVSARWVSSLYVYLTLSPDFPFLNGP